MGCEGFELRIPHAMGGAERIREDEHGHVFRAVPSIEELPVFQFEKRHVNCPWSSACACGAVDLCQYSLYKFFRAARVVVDVEEPFEVGGGRITVQALFFSQD